MKNSVYYNQQKERVNDMTKKREIEILVMDGCTSSEAEKHLNKGTIVFDDFEEHFDDYMDEWGIDEEEKKEYKAMIDFKNPVVDWGIVEDEGNTFYIMYVL